MNQQNLWILLLSLITFEAASESFRTKWKGQEPLASSLQVAVNTEADLMNSITFLKDIFDPVKAISSCLECQIIQWLPTRNDSAFYKATNEGSPQLNLKIGGCHALYLVQIGKINHWKCYGYKKKRCT